MSAFTSAIANLIDAARGNAAWVEELNALSRAFVRVLPQATPAEVDNALRQFATLFPDLRPVAAGPVGISCGSLVENGGDPRIAGPALLDLLPQILESAAEFYRLCGDRVAADADVAAEVARRAAEDPAYDTNDYIRDETWDALAQRFGPAIFQTHPLAVLGHMARHFYSLGVIAHLSRSKELRAAARARPALLEASARADDAAGNGTFLTDMLRVLDDERLIVLHPGERKGFDVRISGVADNFQLHTLLAAELIGDSASGLLTGVKLDPAACAAARDGASDERVYVTGAFNLWNWPGLQTRRHATAWADGQ